MPSEVHEEDKPGEPPEPLMWYLRWRCLDNPDCAAGDVEGDVSLEHHQGISQFYECACGGQQTLIEVNRREPESKRKGMVRQ